MKVFYIDLAGVNTREGLQDALARELPLPAGYGRNLDALHDVLSEYGGGWDVIFYNTRDLADALPGYYRSLERLLADVARERQDGAKAGRIRIRIYP